MFRSYLKTAIRSIIRQKGYSLINIFGLSVGLAAFVLISLWIYNELNYNGNVGKSDRIFRFVQQQHYATGPLTTPCMPGPLAADAKRDFPEIESIFRFYEVSSVVSNGDKKFIEDIITADSSIFSMFDFEALYGSLEHPLNDPFTAVITRREADKIFGRQDVVGQTIRVNDQQDFRITAVVENPPENSSFTNDVYIPFEYIKHLGYSTDRYGSNTYYIYALLKEGVDQQRFNEKLEHYFRQVRNDDEITTVLFLFPLGREQLYRYDGRAGTIKNIYTFGIIAVFILLIACINFMNLATARASKRSREIGLRKVAGATRSQLIRQFLGESVVMALLSLIIALGLVYLLLPVFNRLTGKELSFVVFNPLLLIILLGVTLLTGLLAGSYPAIFLSSFSPEKAIRSSKVTNSGHLWFRRGLVVFQFVLSVGLIISTLVIYKQLNFMLDKDLGMNKENVVYFQPRGRLIENFDAFKAELKRDPNVQEVSLSSNLPFMVGSNSGSFNWQDREGDDDVLITFQFVETDFPRLMKLKLLTGRFFSREYATDSTAVLINRKCADLMGYDNPVGKWISWGGDQRYHVIGLLDDFNIQKLNREIPPLVMFNEPRHAWTTLVRISGNNTDQTIDAIEKTWNDFVPAFPFEFHFLDKTYEKYYTSDRRLSRLIEYFALLAIIISCLGLFGLASYMAEQKTREIGIRKVLGSSVGSIVAMQQREFMWLVIIANIIAWPFAWLYMNNWLDEFAFKISLSPAFFIVAGVLSVVITFLTVFVLAYRAALRNPVDAIKYE